MSPVPAVVTLGNPRIHSSPPDCSCMMPKIKRAVNKGLALGTLLRVPDVNLNHKHVWAWRCLHNARARSKHYSFKDRSVSNHRLNLSLCNGKWRVVALVKNTQNLQEKLWQMRLYHSTSSQANDFLELLLDYLQLCCRCNKVSRHGYSILCLAHWLNSKLRVSLNQASVTELNCSSSICHNNLCSRSIEWNQHLAPSRPMCCHLGCPWDTRRTCTSPVWRGTSTKARLVHS